MAERIEGATGVKEKSPQFSNVAAIDGVGDSVLVNGGSVEKPSGGGVSRRELLRYATVTTLALSVAGLGSKEAFAGSLEANSNKPLFKTGDYLIVNVQRDENELSEPSRKVFSIQEIGLGNPDTSENTRSSSVLIVIGQIQDPRLIQELSDTEDPRQKVHTHPYNGDIYLQCSARDPEGRTNDNLEIIPGQLHRNEKDGKIYLLYEDPECRNQEWYLCEEVSQVVPEPLVPVKVEEISKSEEKSKLPSKVEISFNEAERLAKLYERAIGYGERYGPENGKIIAALYNLNAGERIANAFIPGTVFAGILTKVADKIHELDDDLIRNAAFFEALGLSSGSLLVPLAHQEIIKNHPNPDEHFRKYVLTLRRHKLLNSLHPINNRVEAEMMNSELQREAARRGKEMNGMYLLVNPSDAPPVDEKGRPLNFGAWGEGNMMMFYPEKLVAYKQEGSEEDPAKVKLYQLEGKCVNDKDELVKVRLLIRRQNADNLPMKMSEWTGEFGEREGNLPELVGMINDARFVSRSLYLGRILQLGSKRSVRSSLELNEYMSEQLSNDSESDNFVYEVKGSDLKSVEIVPSQTKGGKDQVWLVFESKEEKKVIRYAVPANHLLMKGDSIYDDPPEGVGIVDPQSVSLPRLKSVLGLLGLTVAGGLLYKGVHSIGEYKKKKK